MPNLFNARLKQLMILFMLLLLLFLGVQQLIVFLPGLLGALTLYILSRDNYFRLTEKRGWGRGLTAGIYIFGYLLLLSLLFYVVVVLLKRRIEPFLNDPSVALNKLRVAITQLEQKTGISLLSDQTIESLAQKISGWIPGLVNDTITLLLNLVLMLFLLYYMLVNGNRVEHFAGRVIPLRENNIRLLAAETKTIVTSSALGIPLISIIQGITAAIGYVIFGVEDYILWGFLTGVFAFFPILGTMVIWVPLVVYGYAAGHSGPATGLLLYSLLITGNIDYVARISLMKKLGDVHPVTSVLGVIIGLGLFGFVGLIFGPLLVNYIILLFRIYSNEFLEGG